MQIFDPYQLKELLFKFVLIIGILIVLYGVLWLLVNLKVIPALIAILFPQVVIITIGLLIIYVAITRKNKYY